jgi:hypothetical protein
MIADDWTRLEWLVGSISAELGFPRHVRYSPDRDRFVPKCERLTASTCLLVFRQLQIFASGSERALRACFLLARVKAIVFRSLLPDFRFTMYRYVTIL